jgi:hypothetical protein
MPRGQDEVFQISKADGKNLEMLQRMGIDPIYDRWGKDGKQF